MNLLGAWKLESFVTERDGEASFPFGPDAEGQIVYTKGWMSAVLSRSKRTLPGTTRLEDSHRASDSAKAEAFDSYLSYAGRWRVEGDTVVHTVEMSLAPGAVGQEQRRQVRWLEDGMLELSYALQGRSGVRNFRLLWSRLEDA